MLDGHRDTYGQPTLVPDRSTFCALLEGAKRVGDLAKVRWILAEIVAESMRAARGDVRDAVVGYATYKVQFVRGSTVLLDKAQPSDPSASSEDAQIRAQARARGLHRREPLSRPRRHVRDRNRARRGAGPLCGTLARVMAEFERKGLKALMQTPAQSVRLQLEAIYGLTKEQNGLILLRLR